MRELLIATHNQGKIKEIERLLEGLPLKLLSMDDAGFESGFRVEEVGETFEGNALIKAFTCGKCSGKLTLAEDSGIEVDALGGAPGVLSARYAEGSDADRNAKLLEAMKNAPDAQRGAQYRAVVAIYDPERGDKLRLTEGLCRGRIERAPEGNMSFGYDPIFRYDDTGKVGGMMTIEEKNAVSHRGRAFAKAREVLLKEFV
jgi:XTP/dITP diphosphohydrolase